MKRLIISLTFALLVGAPLAIAQWVQETAGELAVAADWNSDGMADLLVVDRATGLLRAGMQLGSGAFEWREPQAAGPENVTAVGFGRFLGSTAPALAVTSPALNRLNLVRFGQASPEAWFIAGLGPRAMALTLGGPNGIGGDLFVATSDNGAPGAHRMESWSPPAQLAGSNAALARGQAVGTDRDFAFIARAADAGGTADALFFYPNGNASFPTVANGLPLGADWAWGTFGAATQSFLFWKTGSPGLTLRPLNRAIVPLAFDAAVNFNLGDPIHSVTVMTGGPPRLLIIFNNGASAGVFTFDGIHVPVLVQSLTPPIGGNFRTVLPLNGGDFALFSGPAGGTTSATAQRHRRQADNTYLADAPSALSPLPAFGAARTNVLLFSSEPFVSPTAQLFSSLRARDWSVASDGLPGMLNVQAEIYQGSQNGLGARQTIALGALSAGPQTFALANQYADDLSIMTLAPATGAQVLTVNLTPPPGPYRQPLTILASSSLPGAELYYRQAAGGAWSLFDPAAPASLRIEVTGFVEIHARSGILRSPIVGGNYLIGTIPPGTLAGPGISPELLEYFGNPPLNEDPDGDGVVTGVELLAGSDPDYHNPPTDSGQPQLRITAIDPPSATLYFRLTGKPGIRHAVESSSTLTPGDWTDHISEFTMPASGFIDFTAPYVPGQRRFFRGTTR
jgi:hypothetical protein